MRKLKIKKTTNFELTENLPKDVDIVHKGTIKDGRFFAILGKGNDYTKDKVYLSTSATCLEEVEVISVKRMRDGETTIYETKAGEFYFPSLVNQKKFNITTFNKEPIKLF